MNGFPYPYNNYLGCQSLIRVNGLNGARAYQMTPNSMVALFDSNDDVIYIKATDGAGFGSIRTFKYEEVVEPKEEPKTYITRKEMEEYVKQYIPKSKTTNQSRTDQHD